MRRVDPAQLNIAARRRRGTCKRRGNYPVGYDPVLGTRLAYRPLYRHGVRAVPGYPAAEQAQVRRQRRYLRFACRSVDDRHALGGSRGEHDVLRRPDARKRQLQLCPAQLISAAAYLPAVLLYLRAHLPQRREVDVYRPLAELAAARQAQPCHAAARQQRPHEYDRRAHLQHQRMRYRALGKPR